MLRLASGTIFKPTCTVQLDIWLKADAALNDLRKNGLGAFAAVNSSTLETQPDDQRGAIVFETEMNIVIT